MSLPPGSVATVSIFRGIDPGSKTLRETRILLLRHAETSAPERFHGAESDIGLGERGRRQAVAVAEALAAERPDALYCSGMRRPSRPLSRSARPLTSYRTSSRRSTSGAWGR